MIQTFEMFNENVKFVKQPIKKGAKTDVYKVTKDGTVIGLIKWSSRARGYAFLPTEDCDAKVKEFVKDLMQKRRALKKKEKLNESNQFYSLDDIDHKHDYVNIDKLKQQHPNVDLNFEKIIELRKHYSAASAAYQRILANYENDPRRDDENWSEIKARYDLKMNTLHNQQMALLDELRKEENPITKSEILKDTREIGVFDQ